MAVIGGQYVSAVTYSVEPVSGTNNNDLTSTTGSGVTFPSVPGTTGLFGDDKKPLFSITVTFNPAGVDSLGSIAINPASNVDKFSVEFFVASNPSKPVPVAPELADTPLSVTSTIKDSRPSIAELPSQVPSPLSGIRITVLSTTDNK
jgi:hypothetical protein